MIGVAVDTTGAGMAERPARPERPERPARPEEEEEIEVHSAMMAPSRASMPSAMNL